jgi:hypothetical protein
VKLDWSKLTQTMQKSGLHGLHREQPLPTRVPALPGLLPATLDVGNSPSRSDAGMSVLLPVLPDCNEWPGTRTPNVHEVVAAITSVTAKNGKVCEIPEGSGPDHIEHVPEASPAEKYAARSHIFRGAGARCVRARGTWGSEKSLWRDYVGWCQQHKLSSLPRELFCENLNRCFDREKDGWRGIALAVDVEAAKVFLLRRSKPCEFCNKICLLLPECLKATDN